MNRPAQASILIVDDVPTNIQVLAEALRQQHRVKVATNGRDALTIARAEPQPDMVLLDVMMPEMDGYQVLAQLKKDKIRIPVTVVLTNLSQPVTKEECKALGAEDYIVKSDSDAEDVWEKVEKYLPHEGG